MTTKVEERRYPRLAAAVDVTCAPAARPSGDSLVAESRNVSVGGMCIVLDRPYAAGENVSLTFTLPGSTDTLSLNGQIKWVHEYKIAESPVYDAGVEWVGLPPEAVEQIQRYVHAGKA